MRETPTKINPHAIDLEHEDQSDELWIVSYADMMTLLFGFFVILYSFSTLDDKKFDQMTDKMAEAFKVKSEKKSAESDVGVSAETRQIRALQMLVAMLNLGDNVDAAVPKIEKTFAEGKSLEAAKALLVEKVAEQNKQLVRSVETRDTTELQTIEIVLPAAALFPSGGHRLAKGVIPKLQALADDLRHVADLAEIEVVGHTDSQAPVKGALYDSNFTLSSMRAGAVASALVQFGVDGKRINVRGMGDLKPLVREYGDDGRANAANMAKNRRVGILLKVRRSNAPLAH